MLDDLIFALRNFRRNKIRSFLSLLGIIIGVASVIVITSLSESAAKTVEDSFSTAGLDWWRFQVDLCSDEEMPPSPLTKPSEKTSLMQWKISNPSTIPITSV